MLLSIIIPTNNNHKAILGLLESIYAQNFSHEKFEVLIISSLVDFRLKLEMKNRFDQYTNWKFLCAGRTGFDYALKYGAEKAQGDLLYCLSDQCLLTDPKLLGKIFTFCQSQPKDVAIGGPILLAATADPCERVHYFINLSWRKHYRLSKHINAAQPLWPANFCWHKSTAPIHWHIEEEFAVLDSSTFTFLQLLSLAYAQGLGDEPSIYLRLCNYSPRYRERALNYDGYEKFTFYSYLLVYFLGQLKAKASQHSNYTWLQNVYFIFFAIKYFVLSSFYILRAFFGHYSSEQILPTVLQSSARYYPLTNLDELSSVLTQVSEKKFTGLVLPEDAVITDGWIDAVESILHTDLTPIVGIPLELLEPLQIQQILALQFSDCAFQLIPDSSGEKLRYALDLLYKNPRANYWIKSRENTVEHRYCEKLNDRDLNKIIVTKHWRTGDFGNWIKSKAQQLIFISRHWLWPMTRLKVHNLFLLKALSSRPAK